MPNKKSSNDDQDINDTHQRWVRKVPFNRYAKEGWLENWTVEQCIKCRFYIELSGVLGSDWGVCSNPLSPFDSRLMFEHDGCEHYTLPEDDEV